MPTTTPSSRGKAAPLAEIARQDAERLTPTFSEMRHARIMGAVAFARRETTRTDPAASSYSIPARFAMALAASVIIALGTVGIYYATHTTSQQTEQATNNQKPPVPTPALSEPPAIANATKQVEDRVIGVGELVQTAMAHQQYAGLDQDLRAATHYLYEQVPLRAAWESDEAHAQP